MNALGQYEGAIGGGIQMVGGIISQFIQADLAKKMQKRDVKAQLGLAEIEKRRQLALLEAQAKSLESQIVKRALASQVKVGAYSGFMEKSGMYVVGLVGILAVTAVVMLKRKR